MNFITKFINHIFLALCALCLTLVVSCDDFSSKEFDISSQDAKACASLTDTLSSTLNSVLLTTMNAGWVDSVVYNANSNTYSFVPQILDSLENRGIVLSDNPRKFRLVTISSKNESYFSLNTNLNQLVFFFDRNVDVNIIREDGTVIASGNPTIPLETTAGCVVFNEQLKLDVPVIQARISLSVPDTRTLVKIIKNEQTGSSTIHCTIM